ncbi:MAG: HAD-IA family hydrolase [Thermoplasmata archaeon]
MDSPSDIYLYDSKEGEKGRHKKPRGYDLVMVDVGGVLLDHKEARHYRKISEELGIPENEFLKVGFKFARSLERRKTTMPEVEKAILERFKIRKRSRVRGIWARTFRQSVRRNEETIDLLGKLQRMKYRIAISTNTNISDYLVLYGRKGILKDLRKYRIFASCYMGVAKPDRRYYEQILRSMNSPPEKAVFIDDKMENLKPARELGITPVLFRNYSQLVQDLRKLGFKLD